MVGYHHTTHGNYKCDFCDRRAYKSMSGIENHLETNHKVEVLEAKVKARDEELSRKNRRINELLATPPKPEPPKKQEFYDARVFCTACKWVMDSGIPRGQTIESTPHSECGTRNLQPVFKSSLNRL